MDRHHRLDIAQSIGVEQLSGEQRREMASRTQRPMPLVGTMRRHRPVENTPGNELQHLRKHRSLLLHGIDLRSNHKFAKPCDSE